MIRIEKLRFLDWGPIDLSVPAGRICCVHGESGSGKSLLLRAVADLIPHEGDLFLEDRSCNDFPATEWRSKVGYLPAEILWWEDRVGEHFLRPPASEQLQRLGLAKNCLSWEVSRLSMGERQRLGLLRLFDREPQVLLLDEPTANLDEELRHTVESLVCEYVAEKNASTIWVSHDREQANRIADATYLMKDNQLREVS